MGDFEEIYAQEDIEVICRDMSDEERNWWSQFIKEYVLGYRVVKDRIKTDASSSDKIQLSVDI